MQLIHALKQKTYFGIAVVAAVIMYYLLPYVQTLGLHTDLWYQIIPPLHYAFFLVFVVIFGAFVSFQIYKFRGPKVCKVKKNAIGGVIGSGFAFLVGVCPACLGFAALLLPIGVSSILAVFGPVFMVISIGLMLFSIHMNDGFKKLE
ncbi:MAG: hypothetical protein ABIH52_04760 [Candidatus Aenigmatarchaeota archaeon]